MPMEIHLFIGSPFKKIGKQLSGKHRGGPAGTPVTKRDKSLFQRQVTNRINWGKLAVVEMLAGDK